MPRPEPSAGRLSRTSLPPVPQRSARAETAKTTTTTTTTRKRKGTPCKAPSRTEPSLAPASTPILVKVLLKERTRSVDSLDNLRSASSAGVSSSSNRIKAGQVDEDERARKRRKKVAARDALLPSVEGYGRGKRAQSATPAGTTADSDAAQRGARGARGRSPNMGVHRALSPVAAAAVGLVGTSRPGSAYTQHYPIHSSPLSPPNQYRMHRSRSTGPASNSPTLASSTSSSSAARRPSPPTPGSRSPVMTASSLNSTAATSPSLAPSPIPYGNAYAMGISAVSNPSPLAKSFSANGGTVADAVAAATAAANAMPPPPPPRARTPSNTQANGGAYRVAELSGTPIHALHAVAA